MRISGEMWMLLNSCNVLMALLEIYIWETEFSSRYPWRYRSKFLKKALLALVILIHLILIYFLLIPNELFS